MVSLGGALLGGVAGGASVSIIIRAIDQFSSTFAKVNTSLLAIGAGLAAIGTVGAVAIKKTIDTAISFESAFAGVRKTVELTEEGFAELDKRFKDITKTTPVAYEDLAHIGEIAGQLGVSGVDNLEQFTKTIADIAVTTNLTSEAAATSFARIANIMQEPLDNVDKMGSVVVALGNNFATTESEIVDFSNRIAGAGNIVGMTTPQVFSFGTAFSSVGIQAEAGGTAMQQALLEINQAVIDSGDKLDLLAKTSGMTSEAFATQWQTNAAGAMASFITGLGTQGDAASGILDDMGLGGVRAQRAFLSLANAGDLVTKTLEMGSNAWEENTALTVEANKRYQTAQSQITIFKNKVALLSDQMGQVFIPILIKVLDKVGKFLTFLEEHPKITKFTAVLVAMAAAVALVSGAVLILTAVSSPWLLIIAGVTAAVALLAAGLYYLWGKSELFRESVKLLWNLLKLNFLPIIITVKIAILAWKKAYELLKPAIDFIIDKVKTLVTWVKNLITWMNKVTFGIFDTGSEKINKLTDSVKSYQGETIKAIKLNDKMTDSIKDTNDKINDTIRLNDKVTKSNKEIEKSVSKITTHAPLPTIHLNPTKTYHEPLPTIYLNDFILSKGKLMQFNPNDTIIGTKNGMGVTNNIYIDTIQGADPTDMLEAFQRELSKKVSLG